MGHPSIAHLGFQTCRLDGLLDNPVAVVRMHRGVAIAMENDGRHWRSTIGNFRPASID
jgi:hypothetical protein